MKACILIAAVLIGVLPVTAQIGKQEWERRHQAACDQVEARYPASRDESSAFSIILLYKVQVLARDNPAAMQNPEFIIGLADRLAAELEAFGNRVVKIEPKVTFTPAPQKEAPTNEAKPIPPSPAEQDIQAYLDAHAGKRIEANRNQLDDRMDDMERRQEEMEWRRIEEEQARFMREQEEERRRMEEEQDRFMRENR